MGNPLTLSAIDLAYRDVERLVYHTAHAFRRRYGGDFEELLSEANEHFMHAFHTFDPGRGQFPARVRHVVWHGLLETLRKEANRKRLLARADINLDGVSQPGNRDWLADAHELSDDAAAVLGLVLEPPPEIRLWSRQRDQLERYKAKRSAVVELLHEIGWCSMRIAESFQEIREILK